MGSRGQSSGKAERRAARRAKNEADRIRELEQRGDELDERIGELLEEYRDERGFVNSEETEKDPRIQEARKAREQIDSELLDRVAKPIEKSTLPKGVEGDERNSELDWDMAKINATARDFAWERIRHMERTGAEEERKKVWEGSVKAAISRAEANPYEYSTNYRPLVFASEGKVTDDKDFGTTYKVLRVYSDKRGKKVELEVKYPGLRTPQKVREYIRYDENHNEYIYHGRDRIYPYDD